MATRTLVTFEQFEKYPDDGHRHELLQGEHIILPPAKSYHSDVQHLLLRALQPYVDQHRLGYVRIEAGLKLLKIPGCNRTSLSSERPNFEVRHPVGTSRTLRHSPSK